MDKIKVACYARVSTDSQTTSYDNQREYFEKIIKDNPEWEFAGMYADNGITGTSLTKRPEFDKMLTDAGVDIQVEKHNRRVKYSYWASENREPKFNLIIIKNTSRFARNVTSIDIVRELRRKGVYIFFSDIKKSTKDMADEFLIQLFQLLDEQESKDKSEKVKFGHERGAENGIINVNSRIYGYEFIKGVTSKENQLVPIPHEADVVKKVFELYADGLGMRRILNYLKENKLFTREGKEFSKTTISKMLSNEKYMGMLVRNKYDTGRVFEKTYPKVKDDGEWKKHENAIPAIISPELFYKCQEIRKSKTSTINQKGIYHGTSEYAGLIVCGNCGCTYTRNVDRGNIFYNCSKKKSKGVAECNSPNLYLSLLEKTIEEKCNGELLKEHRLIADFNIFRLNKIKDNIKERIDQDTDEEVKTKQVELQKLKIGYERLVDIYMEGELDKEVYLRKNQKIKEEIEHLEENIAMLSKTNGEYYHDMDDIDKAIEKFKNVEVKDKYSKEELLDQLKMIEVAREDGQVKLFFVMNVYETYRKMIKKYDGML